MMTAVQIQAKARQRQRARKQASGKVDAVWEPQEGVQKAAYESVADVIGYGGAAGGGKSDLQLGFAGTKHRRSIIFRRVFPSLRGIIERSREVFARGISIHAKDRYNEQLHVWRLSDGRMIEFGACQYEQDWKKHQGQPRDFMGFDEATQFPEMVVRTLMGWNRTTTPGQRCRVLLTFNPPTDDGEGWVVSFFAPWIDKDYPDPADDGEIRYVARIDDRDCFFRSPEDAPEEVRGSLKTRTFFHASLKDNPILAATDYGSTIDALPEPLRSLLKGNFDANKIADPWQTIPSEWVLLAQKRWRERQRPEGNPTAKGCDVARGGTAKTVISRWWWNYLAELEKHPGRATPDGPSVAALLLPDALNGVPTGIDIIGVGSSAYDTARGQGFDCVVAVHFGEGSKERDKSGKLKFRNVRAAAYWKLREALDPVNGGDIALPDDPELKADLCAPRYSVTSGGILIESKEEIVDRLGRSPDCGDAAVIGHYTLTHGLHGQLFY